MSRIDEIQRFVEVVGNCGLYPDKAAEHIRYLLSQLKDGGSTECVCGHPKSDHELFSDHDECLGCRGLDEPCSEFRATVPTETSARCGEQRSRCRKCGHDAFNGRYREADDPAYQMRRVPCGCKCVFPASTEQTRERQSVVNFEAWTTIDKWLRENPKATAAECLTELVKRIKVGAAPAPPVAQPASFTDEELEYLYLHTDVDVNPDLFRTIEKKIRMQIAKYREFDLQENR